MRKVPEFFIATVLALLFTVALTYLTLEIPNVINKFLLNIFPEYGAGEWLEAATMLESLRPFGYISFTAMLILIVTGFVVKRGWLTTLGSIALYLPTFGYFAFTMFFLVGIGVLRVLWLPLLDLSPNVLRLGEIVYLPFTALAFLFAPVVLTTGVSAAELYIPFSFIVMGLGLAVFLLGILTWLYGSFKGFEIIDFGIYKHSRHPQYLGFLLWSYGLLLLANLVGAPKGGYVPPPSLPWLFLALTIVGVTLHEENIMVKNHGEKYDAYREKTPLMFPLPKKLSAVIVAPAKGVMKKNWPENGKEIAFIITVYGGMLVLSSLPSVLFL